MPAAKSHNYHEVLQTRRGASIDEIRAAYKQMALKWHPDRHAADKELANEKFVEVYQAYRALMKKTLRERHVRFSDEQPEASVAAPSPKSKSAASPMCNRSPSMKTPHTDSVEKPKPDRDRRTPSTTPSTPSAYSQASSCPSLHSPHSPNLKSAPLRPMKSSIGASKEWIFPLTLSLKDLYRGTCQRYTISRHLISGETTTAIVTVEIPPGCRDGTHIRVPGVGNQRKDGTLQDIVFLVVQQEDDRYVRAGDDLITNVQLPCRESSCYFEHDDIAYVEGMDGHMYLIPVPLSLSRAAEDYRIKGAGMPIRHGRREGIYGDMLVRWNMICCHSTKTPHSKRKVLKRRHI